MNSEGSEVNSLCALSGGHIADFRESLDLCMVVMLRATAFITRLHRAGAGCKTVGEPLLGNLNPRAPWARLFGASCFSTTTSVTSKERFGEHNNVILMGSPGAGKTTVGQIVAARLGWSTLDVDDDVLESHWGMMVREKLSQVGGEQFLEAEGQALLQMDLPSDTVITLSGSNPMHEGGMDRISKSGVVVFLDVENEEILQRLEMMKVDRIIGQEANVPMSQILAYRQQFYERKYDVRIMCEAGETQESVADKIVHALDTYRDHSGFISTRAVRSERGEKDFLGAVLQGLAEDGGLYVPSGPLPRMSAKQWQRLIPLTYQQRAQRILEQWLHPSDLHPQTLNGMIQTAYNTSSFRSQEVVPITHLEGDQFVMEVFHGPTASFKDAPLQLMPHFFREAVRQKGDARYLILVATSGDTGSAVLEGFSTFQDSHDGDISVMVFYPEDGVSSVQKALMTSVDSPNVKVIGVQSDFDFCQSAIKKIFSGDTTSLRHSLLDNHNVKLSAANSINWGRLLPQVVYHASAYLNLAQSGIISVGDEVDVCVPTGNFGNILGAVYAKLMGVPLRRLICASNVNHILTDFIHSGMYDLRARPLQVTMSPAIDILKSSNLERLLYLATDCNSQQVRNFYDELQQEMCFKVPDYVMDRIRDDFGFVADWCDEDTCSKAIREVYKKTGYLMDPHTAVAKVVADRHASQDGTPLILCSTAHYGKFASDVLRSLGHQTSLLEDPLTSFSKLKEIDPRPGMHALLEQSIRKPAIHKKVIDPSIEEITRAVEDFVMEREDGTKEQTRL